MNRYTVSIGRTLGVPTIWIRDPYGEVVHTVRDITWRRTHYRAIVWMRRHGGTR